MKVDDTGCERADWSESHTPIAERSDVPIDVWRKRGREDAFGDADDSAETARTTQR